MTLFESEVLIVNHFEQNNLLHSKWKRDPTAEEFISSIKDFKPIADRTPFHTSLWNLTNLDFIIPPGLQSWIDEFLNVPTVKKRPGVQAAFVISRNLMAQLSANEIMEKGTAGLIPQYYIDDNHAVNTICSHKKPTLSQPAKQHASHATTDSQISFHVEIDAGDTKTYMDLMRFYNNNKGLFKAVNKRVGSLTDREKEICRLILKGLGNQEIADTLIIAFETVKTHRKNIFRKLGCHKPVEMAIYSIFL